MRHPDEGEIHAWLDGALDPANATGIEAHVAACPACAAAVAEARGLIAGASRILMALDGVPSGVIPAPAQPVDAAGDDLATRRQRSGRSGRQSLPWYARRPVRIAAGLMLVAGVGGLVVRNRGADTVSIQFETEMAPAASRVAVDTISADFSGLPAATPAVSAEQALSAPERSATPAQVMKSTVSAPSGRADAAAVGGADVANPATLGGVATADAFAGRREQRAAAEQGAVRPPPPPPVPAPAPPVVATGAASASAARLAAVPVSPPSVALADSMSSSLNRQSATARDRSLANTSTTTGTITGKVVTTENAPLGLVSVFIQSAGVGTTTREDGTFTLPPLPPGRYKVEARRIGYQAASVDGVQLASGETTHASLALSPSTVSLSEVIVTGGVEVSAPRVGSTCFALDVDEGAGTAGIPLLPRRVRFRTASAPLDADASKATFGFALPGTSTQRRSLARTASEPAVPLEWRALSKDSIEVSWPAENDVITLRLEVRETSLRGTSVRGTATSTQGTPPRTATVSGRTVGCDGG